MKKQSGAVLAFSLVMLLLLTMVSINMIQQNKSQITIAANTGQQIQTFASVETALRLVQHQVDEIRLAGTANDAFNTSHRHCRARDAAHTLDQGDNITSIYNALPGVTPYNDGAVTASVYSVSCMSQYGELSVPNTGNENQCFYVDAGFNRLSNGVANGFRDTATLTTPLDNRNACIALNNAGPWSLLNWGGWVAGTQRGNGCQMELYTLNVTFLDSSNASRTVQSKFQIDCSNDLNLVDAPGT